MFGLVLQQSRRRPEDEHWWDPDPYVRAKNRRLEAKLEHIITGGPDDDDEGPPRRRKGDGEVHQMFSALLKFGLIPGMFAWLVYMGVMNFRVNQEDANKTQYMINQTLQQHMHENRTAMDEMKRMQARMVDLMRAQCVNTSRTYQERQSCLQAGSQ